MAREFAVIGLGRFGAGVALGLAERGQTVIGVDHDREIVQDLADQLSDVVVADACDEAALRLIGVSDFDSVVVAIGDFESNLLAVAALKDLGARQIIAKALTTRQAEILRKIGADEVVLPEQEAGERLAIRLVSPATSQALKEATGIAAGERPVPDDWIDKSPAQLKIRQRHGVLAIAIRRGTSLVLAPSGEERFEIADHVVFVGPEDRLMALGCRVAARQL